MFFLIVPAWADDLSQTETVSVPEMLETASEESILYSEEQQEETEIILMNCVTFLIQTLSTIVKGPKQKEVLL